MYGSSYYGASTASKSMAGAGVWTIVALVIAIIGGIALYFTFLSKKNEGRFNGFLGWMYEFLTFKKMLIEGLLKVLYIIFAIFITLVSFNLISTNFLLFVLVLVVGNLIARIIYEFSLILLVICKNTTEINKKMTNDDK